MVNANPPSDAVVAFTRYWMLRAGWAPVRPLTIGEAMYFQGRAWHRIIQRDGKLAA